MRAVLFLSASPPGALIKVPSYAQCALLVLLSLCDRSAFGGCRKSAEREWQGIAGMPLLGDPAPSNVS